MASKPAEFNKLIQLGAKPDEKLSITFGIVAKLLQSQRLSIRRELFKATNFWPDKGDTALMAACLNPFKRKHFILPALEVTKDPNQRDELDRNLCT